MLQSDEGKTREEPAAPPSGLTADASALVARDWSAALALQLNDNGDPVPFDP